MLTRLPLCLLLLALAWLWGLPARAHAGSADAPRRQATSPPAMKVFVEQEGIVQITGADLMAAGWDIAGLDSGTLRLTVAGLDASLWVSAAAGVPLQPGDLILFYGRPGSGRYSARAVYWLTAGEGAGLRMAERDAAPVNDYPLAAWWPATLHAERDTAPWGYWQNPPGREAQDHWYWTGPLNAPAEVALPFALPAFDPAAGPFTLRVRLAGRTDAIGPELDHHTRILLNGQPLADARWDGLIQFVHTAVFTPSLVAAGANTVTVAAVGDTGAAVDGIYANWIEVAYAARYVAADDRLFFGADGHAGRGATTGESTPLAPQPWGEPGSPRSRGAGGAIFRAAAEANGFQVGGFSTADIEVYDITDPLRPVRLRNVVSQRGEAGFAARFEDRAPPNARYLALTPAVRRRPAALQPVASADLRDGANTADEIILAHDEFYDEILPLVAHRRAQGLRVRAVRISEVYDAFAWGSETPQAIRDFLAHAYRTWQAPPPSHVLLVGDANLDYRDRFGTGRPNFVPTFVFDAAEVGETASDAWFVQIAGDDLLPDMAIGRLPAASADDVRAMVAKILAYDAAPGGLWQSQALFVADGVSAHQAVSEAWLAGLPAAYRAQRVFAAAYPPGNPTADIVAAFNQGAALVSYIGHGNIDRWGTWSGGRLFDVTTIGQLSNGGRLPLVATADCLNGFFVHPYTDATVAEAFMRKADGGAIAVWSSSGLGAADQQATLFAGLLAELVAASPPTVGEAILRATAAGARAGVSPELISTFILFGDPALRLRFIPAARQFLPLLMRDPAR